VPAFLEMAKKGELNEITNAAKTALLHLPRPQTQRERRLTYSAVCAIFTKRCQNITEFLKSPRNYKEQFGRNFSSTL
jgi:hypothetical protein